MVADRPRSLGSYQRETLILMLEHEESGGLRLGTELHWRTAEALMERNLIAATGWQGRYLLTDEGVLTARRAIHRRELALKRALEGSGPCR